MKNKLLWIDGTKLIAILAVVVVHCNGIMYTNEYIAMATGFSVTLFVLISGIGTGMSYKRHPDITFTENAKKLIPFLRDYAVATVIVSVWNAGGFDVPDIICNLVHFSAAGTYYFLFFFIQLKLIAPFLCAVNKKYADTLTKKCFILFALMILSGFLFRYAVIAPSLYGGGKYLFGSTYLFVFTLGIMLADFDFSSLKKRYVFVLSAAGWVFMWLLIGSHRLPLNTKLRYFFGYGENPPFVTYILFTLLTLILCYLVFDYIEFQNGKFFEFIKSIVRFFGENTMYIFLYHLTMLHRAYAFFSGNKMIMRFVVFPALFILPSVAANRIKKRLRHSVFRMK